MKEKTYILWFLILFFGGALLVVLSKGRYQEKISELSREDYLANLRESSTFGCRTFAEKKPSVLFIGDSHSYSGWDFVALSNAFPKETISSCTMGGFYLETIPLLFEVFEKKGVYPKKIIYGVSPRQFGEFPDKFQALGAHRGYLASEYSVRDFIKDLAKHLFKGKRETQVHTSYAEQEKNFQETRTASKDMKPLYASAYMQRFPNDSQTRYRDFIQVWKFTEDADQKIQKACDLMRSKNIEFVVVQIPESPFLENMYGEVLFQNYQQIIKSFSRCARVIAPDASLKISDKDFVNRNQDPKFPYDKMQLGQKISYDQNQTANYDYDVDHLNYSGAKKFTDWVLPQLKDVLD